MRIIYGIKALIRYLQFNLTPTTYKTYDVPDNVAGYLGWHENAFGQVIAFVDADNRIQFNW